ncbi:hypothetical protein [Methylocella tundrae]|uniref:SGNH hydrolase-type esterase domain-containing protein n=1 Tax=Methylocella tundrae TaxID=227605 RepID=A0A4V6IM50_METTU|nr:hypothetical protein [Methylocella tundrae]WPP04793.1 hypothetical protein SIN04_02880 [Methylocella tundrae]VFU07019.1 conserved protein of unknown function [Methylocella tundrae]
MSDRYRKFIYSTAIAILVFAAIEGLLRLLGFGSFPIYDVDSQSEYIPSSNQKGVFLNKNNWFFNDRHLGNAENWNPGKRPNVLLVGNSILLGGLPYNQPDKVAPRLEKALGTSFTVWSAAAGGWTNVNEMDFFDHNEDLIKHSSFIVIEYMEGGLSQAAPWPGYALTPNTKPLLLSVYSAQKYILPYLIGLRPVNEFGPLPVRGAVDPMQFQRFTNFVLNATKTSSVLIFFYPTKQALADKESWARAIEPINAICKVFSLNCIDFAKERKWSPDLYRRDMVHPTQEGNKVIAEILASAIQKASAKSESIVSR